MTSTRRALHTTMQMQDQMRRETSKMDNIRNQVLSKLHQDNIIIANARSDNRVETKRLAHRLHEESQEVKTVETFEKEKLRREALETQRRQEEALAKEMEAIQLADTRDKRIRQQLRQNNHELRALERDLKTALLTKEHDQVRAHLRDTARSTKQEQLQVIQDTTRQIEEAYAWEESERIRLLEENRAYRAELAVQIKEDEAKKLDVYKEFLKEKKQIDDICNAIMEAEQIKRNEEKQNTLYYKQENIAFMNQQKEHRIALNREWEVENDKIEKEIQEMQAREAKLKEERQKKTAMASEARGKVGDSLFKEQQEKLEMERVRLDLAEEEMLQRNRAEMRRRFTEDVKKKLDAKAECAAQILQHQEKKKRELQEEKDFEKAMMEKFARDDKLHQLDKQKARMKQQDHIRQVGLLVDERRKRKLLEKEQYEKDMKDFETQFDEEKRIIEEERAILLREHASQLLGYLPKGVIRGPQDLELLGEDFKRAYAPKPKEDHW